MVDVVVAVSRFGHSYLKTQADGEVPDNLLSLPECRRRDRALRVVVTTDIALGGLPGAGLRRAGDRFVVLRAGAFGLDEGDEPTAPLPVEESKSNT